MRAALKDIIVGSVCCVAGVAFVGAVYLLPYIVGDCSEDRTKHR